MTSTQASPERLGSRVVSTSLLSLLSYMVGVSVLVFYNALQPMDGVFLLSTSCILQSSLGTKCHLRMWPNLHPLPRESISFFIHMLVVEVAVLITHHWNKKRCTIYCHKYVCSNRNIIHISKRGAPTSGVLERLPGSCLYLPLLHSAVGQSLEHSPIRQCRGCLSVGRWHMVLCIQLFW